MLGSLFYASRRPSGEAKEVTVVYFFPMGTRRKGFVGVVAGFLYWDDLGCPRKLVKGS